VEFVAEITIEEWKEERIYRLSNDTLTAYINPADGMNVVKLCFHEIEVISYQEHRARAGATYGIPILFPTPNRTKDSVFIFDEKRCSTKMHGIARNAAFNIEEVYSNHYIATIKGSLSIEKDTLIYSSFPFACTLTVQISLSEEGLHYQYEVINQDNKRLPFGFGLHPFFNKINDETLVCIPTQKMMVKDENFIPTGQILNVKDTPYDLSRGKKISELDLDDVYMNASSKPAAILTFKDFQIVIDYDEAFSHMVIYTPKDESFFCIEPQTCSTDAINLYEYGEKEASNLTILEAGEKASGEVMFKII
jgi:aldose 1-epimerase